MKNSNHKLSLFENLIYLIIWLAILILPIWENKFSNANAVNWNGILHAWKFILPFFALFLINNLLLLPYLLLREKWWQFFLLNLGLVALVLTINLEYRPQRPQFNEPLPWDIHGEHKKPEDLRKPPLINDDTTIWERPERIPLNTRRGPGITMPDDSFKPLQPMHLRRPLFLSPSILDFLIALFIIGLNTAIKYLFKSIRDEQRLQELERQTSETELAYLKHQINPHFFMNTLNNIHALIDLDKEKAQKTVIELSKIMRYVLYESSLPTVPLEKEIRFMENYIELMKIRYTQQVDICISLPKQIPNVQIPPLLFISFLENAFKHGISYKKPSFIHLTMEVKEKELHYLLINSKADSKINDKGIGLENTRKRLQLLFANNYTLKIDDQEDDYRVLLIIPIQ